MHSDWLKMKLFMDNLWKSLWKRNKRSKHTKLCRKILFFNLSNFEFCQIPAAANLNVNDISFRLDERRARQTDCSTRKKQFREFLTAVRGILYTRFLYLRLKTTDFWATYV